MSQELSGGHGPELYAGKPTSPNDGTVPETEGVHEDDLSRMFDYLETHPEAREAFERASERRAAGQNGTSTNS